MRKISADEAKEVTGVSKATVYKIIRQLNAEPEANVYRTV